MTKLEKAAEKFSNKTFPILYGPMSADLTYNQCSYIAFKAGAEYEREHAKVLVEHLKGIESFFDSQLSGNISFRSEIDIMNFQSFRYYARQALEKYRGES